MERRSLWGGLLTVGAGLLHNVSAIGDPSPALTLLAPAAGLLGVLMVRARSMAAAAGLAAAYGLLASAASMWAGVGLVMPAGITAAYHLANASLVAVPMTVAAWFAGRMTARPAAPILVIGAYTTVTGLLGLIQEVPGVGTWHPFAYGLAQTAWGQTVAGVGGVHLLVIWTAMTQASIAALLSFGRAGRLLTGVAAIVAVALPFALGPLRPEPEGPSLTVAAIVSVLPPEIADRWWLAERADIRPQDTKPVLDSYYALTARAIDAGADLIVWPENAVFFATQAEADALHVALHDVARTHGVAIVAAYRNQEASRNEAVTIGPAGVEDVYHKRFLVPDIEDALNPGTRWFGASTPLGVGTPRVAVRICFDNDYPAGARAAALDGAALIVNPTEDWRGIEATHLAVHSLRSAETGVPMIRAALNGYSALIGPDGAVRARRLSGRESDEVFLIGDLPLAVAPTLYTRYGDAWVKAILTLAMVVLLGGAVVMRRRRAAV